MKRDFDLAVFNFILQLTFLFAVGKVFGFLAWSWLWVFSPILVVIGVAAAIVPGFFLVIGYMDFIDRAKGWFER